MLTGSRYYFYAGKRRRTEKNMQTIEQGHVFQVCRNLFHGNYSVFVAGLGKNRPVGARCKILEMADMIGWDEKWMRIIKCCGDIGLMHDPKDQVCVIFEWKDEKKSPSTETLLTYMRKKGCELLVSGSPGIGKSLEVFWAAVQYWQEGSDVVWLNHAERDLNVIFMPAGEKYALSFHCIDAKLISEDIVHNLGEATMLIHDGWTSAQKVETKLQPEYTQSCQVCVPSGKTAVNRIDFKLLSYSGWDLDELVKAMDSSKFIKDLFIGSSMISLYNILAEYFETFIHNEDANIPQDTLKFVLDTLANLQKKVKEENRLMLDNAKKLLNDKTILLNKLIE